MENLDLPRLVYLSLLVCAVGGWFIAENRHSLGRTARQAAAWGLIFLGVIAAIGLWSDIRTTILPGQSVSLDGDRIEIPRSEDGHYYVKLLLNGTPTMFIVDTGASEIVLSQADAERAGIDVRDLRYLGSANTANGAVRTARILIDSLSLGEFTDSRVPAAVNGGDMEGSLLGMSYLERFGRMEISGGKLVLER